MAKQPANDKRQQRLAAKLRENLRRRKAQSRARATSADTAENGEGEAHRKGREGDQP